MLCPQCGERALVTEQRYCHACGTVMVRRSDITQNNLVSDDSARAIVTLSALAVSWAHDNKVRLLLVGTGIAVAVAVATTIIIVLVFIAMAVATITATAMPLPTRSRRTLLSWAQLSARADSVTTARALSSPTRLCCVTSDRRTIIAPQAWQ